MANRLSSVRYVSAAAVFAASVIFLAVAARLAGQTAAPAAPSITGPVDPLRFSQLKDFDAFRESSNNADPHSNDDSQHPIAGQFLATLDGERGHNTFLGVEHAGNICQKHQPVDSPGAGNTAQPDLEQPSVA